MTPDRYAVVGNPVAHSKSPRIHAAFAGITGETLVYDRMLVEPDDFEPAVQAFFAGGGRGLNVTVPFKEAAWRLAEKLSEDARIAGAVNTLYRDDAGRLCGDNTDGIGLVRDILHNHDGRLQDARLLVLGAGGASRGIIAPLLRERPASLVIANRTESKAHELAGVFSALGPLQGCGFEALPGQHFDWVINATSASLQGSLPPLPDDLLAPGAWCYDLMYADEPTAFCRWARDHGAEQALDGLGMLVEQAAESFRIWRGIRPPTDGVIRELRD